MSQRNEELLPMSFEAEASEQCGGNPVVAICKEEEASLLQDVLPQNSVGELVGSKKKGSELLAIRPFGVQVDESSEEWVWSNFVSSHRYMTIQLLQRINVEGNESVATCNISLRRPPFGGDFAQELVSYGCAECIPEILENYDNGS
ncbi:hypothetical protein BBI17_002256 [Phytophthora kernoviae]|uniref:Uncharacterized protein n=1 Tax=Phytophthora kernoviae TaxID=325452 RepID=A0A3R7K7F5_9STRA|nr:hypothetical protein BBI17_002256 [Phytophthora kernoviae]